MREIKILGSMAWTREERFEGRLHLVARVVALVQGVHNGVFYPSSELAKYPASWNGIALPVFHPEDLGSANTPSFIEERSVGRLFNVRFDADTGKLIGEVWIDIDKAQTIAPEVLNLIRSGRPLEVSTSLFADDDGKPGRWAGEDYEATVINYRPDHLALLPGDVGACSWGDGCGVRAQARTQVPTDAKRSVQAEARNLLNKHFGAELEDNEPMAEAKGMMKKVRLLVGDIAERLGLRVGEASHDELRSKLQRALDTLDNEGWVHFVREVFDGYVVYEARGHNPSETGSLSSVSLLYKRTYTIDENDEVTLSDEAQEVREQREYIPVSNVAGAALEGEGKTSKENDDMKTKNEGARKTAIDALITCKNTRFDEDDRAWLNTLEDVRLDKLRVNEDPPPADPPKEDPPPADPPKDASPPADTPKDASPPADMPKDNAPKDNAQKPQTVDEYIGSAPPEIQGVLRRSVARDRQIKNKLVEALVANERCAFTKEQLAIKDIGELENLIALARVEVDFSAASGGPSSNVEDDVPDMLPVFPEKKTA